MNEWLEIEILRGLQRLSCLSLDRTPAAEMLPGTAQAWIEALTDGRVWDQTLDAPRVRRAFVVLSKTVRRWPAPVEFVEALPPRDQPLLERQSRPATPEEAAKAMARIKAMLTQRREPEPEPNLAGAPKIDLSSLEAELQQHYDRKRAGDGNDAG